MLYGPLICFLKRYKQQTVFVFFSLMIIYFSSLVARQAYRVAVHEESVIIGNDVLVKCSIQSFVADFVGVIGWIDSEGLSFSVDQQHIGKWLNLVTYAWSTVCQRLF